MPVAPGGIRRLDTGGDLGMEWRDCLLGGCERLRFDGEEQSARLGSSAFRTLLGEEEGRAAGNWSSSWFGIFIRVVKGGASFLHLTVSHLCNGGCESCTDGTCIL